MTDGVKHMILPVSIHKERKRRDQQGKLMKLAKKACYDHQVETSKDLRKNKEVKNK